MWPIVVTQSHYRTVFEGTLCGQQLRTGFAYYLEQFTGDPGTIEEAGNALLSSPQYEAMKTAFLNCVPINYTLNQITIQTFQAGSWYIKRHLPQGDVGGQQATTTANIQATIVRRGLKATRKGVGGIRVPCPDISVAAADGQWTAGYLNLLNILATAMKQDCITGGAPAYIFVPGISVTPKGTTSPTWTDTFETFVQPEVRVIRRRTVGLGI